MNFKLMLVKLIQVAAERIATHLIVSGVDWLKNGSRNSVNQGDADVIINQLKDKKLKVIEDIKAGTL